MIDPNDHGVVYWDSCIFIAWIAGERRSEMEGIRESVRRIKRNYSVMVTSVITDTEVLDGNMTKEAQAEYGRLMRRANVELIDLDPPIRRLAKSIREFYQREKRDGRQRGVVTAADAIHLATAINRNVDAFYTLDKGGKDKVSLLSLSGNVAGHQLLICVPPVQQLTLDLKAPGS
jgi:predicted nucleic acid-binding protein